MKTKYSAFNLIIHAFLGKSTVISIKLRETYYSFSKRFYTFIYMEL